MGLILSPSSFTAQPGYPAKINLEHPLMRGAAYVFSMAGGISTINTRSAQHIIGDPSGKVITPRGVGYGSNNSYFYDDTPNAVQNSGDPHTIFGIWKQITASPSASFGQNNSAGPNTIRVWSGGTPRYDVYLGGYRSLYADSVPANGEIYAFAGVHTGSTQYTLLNGKRQSTTGSFSGGGLGSPWTGFGLSNPLNSVLIFGAIFKGAVPDSAIMELWQAYEKIYIAPDEEIWINTGSGVSLASSGVATTIGAATLSVAIPIVGASAASVTGQGAMSVALPLAAAGASSAVGSATMSIAQAIAGSGIAATVGSGALDQVPQNLAANPGFESGDVTWAKESNWTILNDPSNSRSGNWCAERNALSVFAAVKLPAISCTAGQQYTLSGWIKFSAGSNGSGYMRILTYTSVGALVDTFNGNSVSANSYSKSTVTGTVSATAVSAIIEFVSNSFTTGTMYCDDATFVLNSTSSVPIASSSVTAAIGSANLSLSIPINSAALVNAIGSGTLQQAVAISSSAVSTASGSATLQQAGALSAHGVAGATGQGTISISLALSAAAIANAIGSATLGVSGSFESHAVASVAGQGTLTQLIPVSGSSLSATNGSGSLTQLVPISASSVVLASGQGALHLTVSMNAAALAQAMGVGNLTLRLTLSGQGLTNAIGSATLGGMHRPVNPGFFVTGNSLVRYVLGNALIRSI